MAFRDISPNQFGFVPKSYLKFEHRTNESVTPRSEMGRSQNARSIRDLSPNAQAEVNVQVRGFLTDLYTMVADE